MRSAMQHFQLMQIRMHVRWLHCASQCTDGTKLMGGHKAKPGEIWTSHPGWATGGDGGKGDDGGPRNTWRAAMVAT